LRVAYLGPAGTFSEEAVRSSGFAEPGFDAVICQTIPDVITALAEGRSDRAMVPVENSIEGSVRSALDSLLEAAGEVAIIGEYELEVHSALIVRPGTTIDRIKAVTSHPQALAQCAGFLRERLPQAEQRVAPSTTAAIREVAESDGELAALGPAGAAGLYGCAVLMDDVEDLPGNVTRFAWLAPHGTEVSDRSPEDWKTTLVFSELGNDHPGALVDALVEFSGRGINLVRIESRPQKGVLGQYLFFIDIEGRPGEGVIDEALDGLRDKAESVIVLGAYRQAEGQSS
jgi:prephenate dehydratase